MASKIPQGGGARRPAQVQPDRKGGAPRDTRGSADVSSGGGRTKGAPGKTGGAGTPPR